MRAICIYANRDAYKLERLTGQTITVGDLIDTLNNYPKDTEIFSRCDTNLFGVIDYCDIEEFDVDTDSE